MTDSEAPGPPDPAPVRPAPLTDVNAAALLGAVRASRSAAGSGAWEPPSPQELQRSFPQYELREIIGRGGMGAVYKAWQNSLDRLVAIKILPPDIQEVGMNFAERFKQEAKAMAKLRHPGIVAVYDAGETKEGLLFFVMEYIEGRNVAQLVAEQGRLPAAQALGTVGHICAALAYAHSHGVIHRDIKPSNVMIEADGTVKVADFGLAKLSSQPSETATRSDLSIGTPDYVAPETLLDAAHVDHRADLYAVGVMLYLMLTGEVPRGRFDPPSIIVPGMDPRCDRIVDKAMQSDREKRYSTATEMKKDAEAILAAAAAPSGGRASPARGRMPMWIAATALVALALGSFAWWRQGRLTQAGGDARGTATDQLLRRWRPVPSKLNAPVDRGPVHLQNYDTWGAPGFRLTNVAVRATIAWQPSPPGRNELIKVKARWNDTEHYYACLYGPVVELGLYRAPTSTALQRWSVDPPPAPGEAISLQLACVGDRLAVWVRDRLVGMMDDKTLTEPNNVGVQAVDGHIKRLEYFDLDGLSEAGAFRRLGLDARGSIASQGASATPVSLPATSLPQPSASASAARLASWQDAFAESPLKDAIAKTSHTPQGYPLPAGNHWRFPPQSVHSGALRIRATSLGGKFVSLCAFLDDGSRHRVKFHEQDQVCVLTRDELDPLATEIKVRSRVNCSDGLSHEVLFGRLGGRLWVILDGDILHDVADPSTVPGRFVVDILEDARIFAEKVEYVNFQGVVAGEALKLMGIKR